MQQSFVHEARSGRVVFGAGSRRQLPEELAASGLRRVVVLTTPGQRALGDDVAAILGDRCAGVYDQAVMHVPIDTARKAIDALRTLGADGCVAVGGGSTIGLGKAIALESSLPIVALPTTYAGSEMTPLYGLTDGGIKRTGRDWKVMPRTVIYDPELTYGLPVDLSLTSGMNAIAHAAEGLYAPNGNPIVSLMAEEGIRALASALPRIKASAHDAAARSEALYGAWLCGSVLGNAQMGIHHKLCHILGGSFNLPHAEVHTVILPHALAYNAAHAGAAMSRVGRALGHANGPRGLYAFARQLGVPMRLSELGMPADGLDRAADLVVESPYPNPRPIERDAVRQLLQHAFDGTAPIPGETPC